MAIVTLEKFDQAMRDCYPLPGSRIKQWVIEQWAERAWITETCPRVGVAGHPDNTEAMCRNAGPTVWDALDHDACEICNAIMGDTATREDVKAWRTDRANRKPPTEDREAMSDQVMGDDWKPRHAERHQTAPPDTSG